MSYLRPNRPGTSVTEFFERFPDDRACLEHIFNVRWGDHTPCPKCGNLGPWFKLGYARKIEHKCGRRTSILESTVLYRSNLPVMAWFYAMLLISNSSIGVRSTFMRKQLGLGVKSAARLSRLIRFHMATMERPASVGGVGKMVYVDEAHVPYVAARIGGERRRAPLIVMGFACDGEVISGIIGDRSSKTIFSAIERYVKPGSIIVSDAHASYHSLSQRGWDHIVVNHSVAFHDFKGNTLNNIETYWRVLKRSLSGHVFVDSENFWLYLAEVECRYNRRRAASSLFDLMIQHFPAVGSSERSAFERCYDWRKDFT
jgi:transposase-like protein